MAGGGEGVFVLAGHSLAFILVFAGGCPLGLGLASFSDKHRHLGTCLTHWGPWYPPRGLQAAPRPLL